MLLCLTYIRFEHCIFFMLDSLNFILTEILFKNIVYLTFTVYYFFYLIHKAAEQQQQEQDFIFLFYLFVC